MAYVYLNKYNRKLTFYESIVDRISPDSHEATIYVKQIGENVIIDCQDEDAFKIPLMRPSFCPISAFSKKSDSVLSEDYSSKSKMNIPVAAVGLLSTKLPKCVISPESNQIDSDLMDVLLLTRRAKHMRSFPGVWVPPGGHVDTHEGIQEAVFRELAEETGIEVNSSMSKPQLICAWESCFPTFLDCGEPRRHHLVLYYWINIDNKFLRQDHGRKFGIDLDSSETDAYSWLTDSHAAGVGASFKEVNLEGLDDLVQDSKQIRTFRCYEVDETSRSSEQKQSPINYIAQDRDFNLLTRGLPDDNKNPVFERVSTGTKYAIVEFLKKKRNSLNC